MLSYILEEFQMQLDIEGTHTMTKANHEFQTFLRYHVNLNDTRLERLKRGVRGVTDCLESNLAPLQAIEHQGSYALRTIIKPVDDNDTYDADVQVLMTRNAEWDPKDYITAVRDALKASPTYKDKIHPRTRCVKIDYKGEFSIDVVPRIDKTSKSTTKHYICNYKDNAFEPTDGVGYRDWFNERTRITNGNLKRVVRLLKYLRKHKGNFTTKSILFTTLAGKAIKDGDEKMERVSTIADTLVTVLDRMDTYLQSHSSMPKIRNPALPRETFNRHWTEAQYQNFRTKIHSYAQIAKDAKSNPNKDASIKEWRKLFGDDFGKNSTGGGGNNSDHPNKPNNDQLGNTNPAIIASMPTRKLRKPWSNKNADTQPWLKPPDQISLSVSNAEIETLQKTQPQLTYDPKQNIIDGKLAVYATFRRYGDITFFAGPIDPKRKEDINAHFNIKILLTYIPITDNPWPKVLADNQQIEGIMQKHGITDIEDMHINKTDNYCCLAIDDISPPPQELIPFLNDLVLPFFYRIAYIDKYGLQDANQNLWGEYPHGDKGKKAYYEDILRTTNRNSKCVCGSGLKFKRCCRKKYVDAHIALSK